MKGHCETALFRLGHFGESPNSAEDRRPYPVPIATDNAPTEKETIMFKNIAFSDSADAAYCEKLTKHFANMGITQKVAQDAVATLVEKNVVPDFIPCAATPSMFPAAKAAPAPAASFAEELAFQA